MGLSDRPGCVHLKFYLAMFCSLFALTTINSSDEKVQWHSKSIKPSPATPPSNLMGDIGDLEMIDQ